MQINKILDNRTESKARQDYEKAQANEYLVMSALAVQLQIKGYHPNDIWYSKVDEKESFLDNKVHIEPDYYFGIQDHTYTFEIKCFYADGTKLPYIFIKPYVLEHTITKPLKYPRPYVFVATPTAYFKMKMTDVMRCDKCEIPYYSSDYGKKIGYAIPQSKITWVNWYEKLQFA